MKLCRVALIVPLALNGCAGGASISPSLISGLISGYAGIPSQTISQQMVNEITDISMAATAMGMLRAQLNGQVPTLPVGTPPTPVTVTNTATNPVPAKTVP